MMKLTITIEQDEETGQYVTICQEIGVAACGDDIPAAIESVGHAIAGYIRTCLDLDPDGWPEKFKEWWCAVPPADKEVVEYLMGELATRLMEEEDAQKSS